jgi:glutamine phosphoribosylpyrophosphate amidotransferase
MAPVRDIEREQDYARLSFEGELEPDGFERAVEAVAPDVEVVSLGRSLEVVKQVGSPAKLGRDFNVAAMLGTHGIGHTRLSTESKIDLSHSQPFWAHGLPDVATVHNGHITNYHRLRRIYESRGVRFYTENDSEVIGVFLHDRISQGDSFEEALHRAQHDFDGSYCFLAATPEHLALVKDGFAFKPLVVAESSKWVAVATEDIALRAALGDDFETREPPARTVQVWPAPQLALVY